MDDQTGENCGLFGVFGLKNPASLDELVKGEVYSVSPECLTRSLDRLEGHPNFYRREHRAVTLADGSTVFAWVYRCREVEPSYHRRVLSGDWKAYRAGTAA